MKNTIMRIKFKVNLNLKAFNLAFQLKLLSKITDFYNAFINQYNFFICFKLTDRDNTVIHTKFYFINSKDSIIKYFELIKKQFLDRLNPRDFSRLDFIIINIKNNKNIISLGTRLDVGIPSALPTTMDKKIWGIFKQDYLQIIDFQTTIKNGFIENKICLFDSSSNENTIIFDYRDKTDNENTFVRLTDTNFTQFQNGNVVKSFRII